MGGCPPGAARQLAASRRNAGPGVALLLAVSTLGGAGQDQRAEGDGRRIAQDGHRPNQAAAILRQQAWRVACVDANTQLAAAWQQLAMFPALFARWCRTGTPEPGAAG